MEEQSYRSQLQEWMREIVPYSNLEKYIREMKTDFGFKVLLCTDEHSYSISVHMREGREPYLGCIASARKQLAGENWIRGNDLPDGEFCRETWDNIVRAIVRYELVKLEPIHAPAICHVTVPATTCTTGLTIQV